MEVSKDAVRRLQLEKQGINPWPKRGSKEKVYDVIDRLGCVQIDTVNVVERAHYLTLWTRLGDYDKAHLHCLAYDDRRIFEGWSHAMCYVPMKDWRYFIYANQQRAQDYIVHRGWFNRVDSELFEVVLERVRKEGPLSSRDFEGKKPSSGWWGWKPAKRALEALFSAGILMVTRRDGFQRVFDLTERVLPAWVNTSEPDEEERIRFFVERTMGCLGAIKPTDIRTYYHIWCVKLNRIGKQLQRLLDGMVSEDTVVKLNVGGFKQPYYCLAGDTDRLEKLDEGYEFSECRFINYFDSMLWQADRVEHFFQFKRALEIYLKPEQRRFGYFTLPILYGDRLVGRIDPKMDRKEKTLTIRGLWYEDWFKPHEHYENKFLEALESFARFNEADKIEWHKENCKPISV